MAGSKEEITPYLEEDRSKKEQVADMFDNISGHYDFLNHFLSVGIDRLWRRRAIGLLRKLHPRRILDIATGTGDLALAALKLNPDQVTGVDISNKMLEVGKEKIIKRNLQEKVNLQYGDAENLPFEDLSFDAIVSAFGVRNFGDLEKGLREMSRVLSVGGHAVILEFSKPKNYIFRRLYFFYFLNVLPFIGRLISKDNRAYTYLPESVKAFPDGDKMAGILKNCGFKSVKCIPLTFGISTIYLAEK
ncbi:MAG: bifunctional demethylmenaquinone methyltransferase/2-methoxy-6-polyprenyl-1,4-benzoquinol methylase UbiE [Bacteroidetes bacterium]|nr:bifunctional demethylmenaquinone methyltransferase/2-methoxy-6-polyprenyl-1,4-benzoquinol methylase UbiE [Bacteroidota bacterium]